MVDSQEQHAPAAKGTEYGFFSSAFFALAPGTQFEPGTLGGYYIDLRSKADIAEWPPPWLQGKHVVAVCQWGLGCYERFLAGEGDAWFDGAVAAGEWLLERQERDGPQRGGWPHREPFPHTYKLEPPWLSAMAQGEGASLLVRLHARTGRDDFAAAARAALEPFGVPSREGGVMALLDGMAFPEEYPTDPPSYVLNGAIFALWGPYDLAIAFGDDDVRALFEDGVDMLARTIDRWDTGYWSRYDLHPHRAVNIASPSYHRLHVAQLDVLSRLAPRPELAAALERFRAYDRSPWNRRRALVRKIAFRLLVPRRRLA